MTGNTQSMDRRLANPWRIAGWGLAAALLIAPLVAMRFTDEVAWTGADFIVAALLIGGVGIGLELTMRMSTSWSFRGGAAAAIAGAFFTVWINGAVGMIGSEGNPANLMFLGVPILALVGAIAARFRAAGMATAMLTAGIAHVVVTAVAVFGFAGPVEPREIILTLLFALPWLISAALFRNAAGERN